MLDARNTTASSSSTSPQRANKRGLAGALAWLGAWPLAMVLTGLTYGLTAWLQQPMINRYLLGHPICVGEVAAFWLAVSTLYLHQRAANRELRLLHDWQQEQFVPADLASQPPSAILPHWLAHLADLPSRVRQGRLAVRLDEMLRRIMRHAEPHRLQQDLRDVAERDANAAYEAMGLVRIVIWAIPMLGFLGTVVGITETLGDLDFSDAQQAMSQLKSGLYVAFDTTALAIVLAIVLMFGQHPIDQRWQSVLQMVDDASASLLESALPLLRAVPRESPAHAVQEFAARLESSLQQLLERQAEIWRGTVDAAHAHWEQLVSSATATVHGGLSEALDHALSTQADQVLAVQQQAAEAIDCRWRQWQSILSDHARAMVAQQQALVRQSELIQVSVGQTERLAEQQQRIGEQLRLISGPGDLASATRILADAVGALHEQLKNARPEPAPAPSSNAPRGKAA